MCKFKYKVIKRLLDYDLWYVIILIVIYYMLGLCFKLLF